MLLAALLACLLMQWIIDVLLFQATAASSHAPVATGSGWLLRALAALDAADGRLEAAEALLAAVRHAAAIIAEQGGFSNASGGSDSMHPAIHVSSHASECNVP